MFENIGHEETYKGFNIKIVQDECPMSPDEFDSGCYFATFHRQFEMNPKKLSVDAIREMLKHGNTEFFVFPLRAYIHSGVSLRIDSGVRPYPFNDVWDSATIGVVLVSKKECGIRLRKQAYKAAESYVETWNDYLSGNVWGYVVSFDGEETPDGSCWGFYGAPDKYVLQEAKNIVEYELKQRQAQEMLRVI